MTEKINPPVVDSLKTIQTKFNDYQLKAFPQRQPQFFALELAGECGELANCEKKLWRDPNYKLEEEKLNDEAADVFIALMNYCNSREINLESAVNKKLVEIERRRTLGKMGKTS